MTLLKEDTAKLRSILELHLKSEYHSVISIWLSTVSKAELKGLSIIHAVCKHQGQKRFRQPHSTERELSFREATVQLRKEQMRTYYGREFGEATVKSATDILNYKKLSELEISQTLIPSSLLFLERWISLKDNPDYISLVLQFLRGFYSVVKVHLGISSSSNREHFNWFSQEDRKRFGTMIIKAAPKPPAPKRISSNNKSLYMKLSEVREYYPQESPRERLFKNLKGNGDPTTWISNTNPEKASLYQSSYVTAISPRRTENPLDYRTSAVGRILPDLKYREASI